MKNGNSMTQIKEVKSPFRSLTDAGFFWDRQKLIMNDCWRKPARQSFDFEFGIRLWEYLIWRSFNHLLLSILFSSAQSFARGTMTYRVVIRTLQLIRPRNNNPFSTNLGCFLCLYLFLNLKFDLPTKFVGKRQFLGKRSFRCFIIVSR